MKRKSDPKPLMAALIFVLHKGATIAMPKNPEIYLTAKGSRRYQPIDINPSDFTAGSPPLVVKLIDEGPNASESYEKEEGFELSSHSPLDPVH